jgi:hypothetical protein
VEPLQKHCCHVGQLDPADRIHDSFALNRAGIVTLEPEHGMQAMQKRDGGYQRAALAFNDAFDLGRNGESLGARSASSPQT